MDLTVKYNPDLRQLKIEPAIKMPELLATLGVANGTLTAIRVNPYLMSHVRDETAY